MAKAVEAAVNPGVLRWARETSGTTVEDAARRVRVPRTAFEAWERQEARLTLTQLRELSTYFKRPLAAFLLPEPPEESLPPKDYRMLPGSKGRFERKTRLAVRKALRLRTIAKELMNSLQWETRPHIGTATQSAGSEESAERERERIGVRIGQQERWRNAPEALREWRAAIEQRNVLVLQFSMSVEDARGFSLSDDEPYVIALGSSDAVRARIFTLFHEYGHLLLNQPGICLPKPDPKAIKGEAGIEKWCNAFAGAFLLPYEPFRATFAASIGKLEGQDLLDALSEGARRFKVSEQVLLRRLLDVGLVSRTLFNLAIQKLVARAGRSKRAGGPVRPAIKCLAENGVLFSSLVLEAKNRGVINYSEVSDFLDIRLKHLPEIESNLAKRTTRVPHGG